MSGSQRVIPALAVALATYVVPSPTSAQVPAASFGAYLARHGAGIEATALLHERVGIQGRAEWGTVERALWMGGRLNVIADQPVQIYVAPLAGRHYCYAAELSGTPSGCEYDAEWKWAATVLGGLDMALTDAGALSAGAEFGYRFVDVESRSRWTFGASIRYRIPRRSR
jgi:hypothetical protein